MFLAFLLHPLNLRLRRRLHGKGRAAACSPSSRRSSSCCRCRRCRWRSSPRSPRLMRMLQQRAQRARHPELLGSAAVSADRPRQRAGCRRTPASPPTRCSPGWYRRRQELLQRAAGLSGWFFLGALGSLVGVLASCCSCCSFFCATATHVRARARAHPAGRGAQGAAVPPAVGRRRAPSSSAPRSPP